MSPQGSLTSRTVAYPDLIREQSDLLHQHYPEARFGGFSDIDGTIAFYLRVRSMIEPSSVVLDVGCGRGAFLSDPVETRRDLHVLKGQCRAVIGIDVDPTSEKNQAISEFRLIEGSRWPVADESIDVCVCDWVLEHVEDPSTFFAECSRVVRPGGHLCIRTMNLVSYVGIAARLFPNGLHVDLLNRLQRERQPRDIFRTVYQCNTRRKLTRMLDRAGFTNSVYGYDPEPSYLSSSPALYQVGVWHQRWAPRAFAVTLFGFGARRDET